MAFSGEVYSVGLVICSIPQSVYILRGVQRRCVWAVGRLRVAACLACVAAVDKQARQSVKVKSNILINPVFIQPTFEGINRISL